MCYRGSKMKQCSVEGCNETLRNETHDLCYSHWKMQQAGQLTKTSNGNFRETADSDEEDGDESSNGQMLSSTKVGKHFGLSARRINQVLAELGWIEKYVKGWTPTERGNKIGAEVREIRKSGVPYVVWPESIVENAILVNTIRELMGDPEQATDSTPTESKPAKKDQDFRQRFPAEHRSADGHWVRSRAEMLIDNWLYMQGIVHAVERKLPIEEDVYCDFYLPTGKVYIEFWGMEQDPKYAERMKAKQAIYQRYSLNLVELHDDDIMNIDDVLPRLLLKYGIDCS